MKSKPNTPSPLEIYYKDNRFIPNNPRPQEYSVGQMVELGNLDEVTIVEVIDYVRGFYVVSYKHTKNNHGNPETETGLRYVNWTDISPVPTLSYSVFSDKDLDVRVENQNRDIEGLIRTAHYFGIDLDVDYQRGYVWTIEDKRSLISSVFNRIDIGKFTFVKNDWSSGFLYQVLDGKQRLTALLDFTEGLFSVDGIYFNDLCRTDKSQFLSTPVSLGIIPFGATRKQILRAFYKLNFSGKTMDAKHLNKVLAMIEGE